MSKIAQYLNEHTIGEVTDAKATRELFSTDASVLAITPELVMFPRVTSDIRKAARFSWQLAEKGHVLPLTARGCGSDTTGAAIGKGIIINTTKYLNDIIYIALKEKQKIVHVQPGVTIKELNDALQWHGLTIAGGPDDVRHSTVGGAIANDASGQFSAQYGAIGDAIERLEVVLANGDVIETSRINKRDLNKKKGLQTLEGEIYRQVDGIIEDNKELVEELKSSNRSRLGYDIASVKRKDGSLDLTPLFIGSQGTLGIISEIVLRTSFYTSEESILVTVVPSKEVARDVADGLRGLQPASLETIDGELYETARKLGKRYVCNDQTSEPMGAVVYASFVEFSDRVRERKLKKAVKLLEKQEVTTFTSTQYSIDELHAIREVDNAIASLQTAEGVHVPLLDGASIPAERQEDFSQAVAELAATHHVSLPLHIRVLDDTVFTQPALQLSRVADKQKVFKLLNEYAALVAKHGGEFIASSAEGRIKTPAAYAQEDVAILDIHAAIRAVFDPYGTLNPGVKQKNDLKSLVRALRSEYSPVDHS